MGTAKSIDRINKRRGSVLSLRSDATVVEAARKMQADQVGSMLIVDAAGRTVGIVTEHDITVKVVAAGADPAATFVADVMTRAVIFCSPGTSTQEAQRLMSLHNIRHLPIIQDGLPVGMVSSRDLLAQQLSAMKLVVQKQNRILQQLEFEHPGITAIQTDRAGRLVI